MQKHQLLKQLKPMIVLPQWKVFDEYLQLSLQDHLDALVNVTEHSEVRELQGRIKAIKAIRTLPEIILKLDK